MFEIFQLLGLTVFAQEPKIEKKIDVQVQIERLLGDNESIEKEEVIKNDKVNTITLKKEIPIIKDLNLIKSKVMSYPTKRADLTGQCVYFAKTIREDFMKMSAGKGEAWRYSNKFISLGYNYGQVPIKGALFFTEPTKENEAGHVGVVLGVNKDGKINIIHRNSRGKRQVIIEPVDKIKNLKYFVYSKGDGRDITKMLKVDEVKILFERRIEKTINTKQLNYWLGLLKNS